MPNDNPWKYWLEDFPQAQYGAMIPEGTPSFTNYWRSRFGNVAGQYQTALGKQALAGQPPSLGFGSFLESYPFMQRWQQTSPFRGGVSGFAPSLRWQV